MSAHWKLEVRTGKAFGSKGFMLEVYLRLLAMNHIREPPQLAGHRGLGTPGSLLSRATHLQSTMQLHDAYCIRHRPSHLTQRGAPYSN